MAVRFLVVMKELRWAEAFTMLDAVPLNDFVSATKVDSVATITPYKQDCVVIKGLDNTGIFMYLCYRLSTSYLRRYVAHLLGGSNALSMLCTQKLCQLGEFCVLLRQGQTQCQTLSLRFLTARC